MWLPNGTKKKQTKRQNHDLTLFVNQDSHILPKSISILSHIPAPRPQIRTVFTSQVNLLLSASSCCLTLTKNIPVLDFFKFEMYSPCTMPLS